MSLKKKTHWFRKYTRRHNKHTSLSLQGCDGCLLIAVIVESVIAAEGREGSEPDSVGEKDLSTSIDPDLRERDRKSNDSQTNRSSSEMIIELKVAPGTLERDIQVKFKSLNVLRNTKLKQF